MLDGEIKKEILKCSRCALCLSSCPIYEIKKDENNTSRGLICKLSGLENKAITEDVLKKDLKICLFCEKCQRNCPSKISTTTIFTYKNAQFSPSKLNQKFMMSLKLLPIRILYFLNIFKKYKKENLKTSTIYFKGCMAHAQHKTTFLDKLYQTPDFACCGLPYLATGDIEQYNKAKNKNIEIIKKAKQVIFDCATCISSVKKYKELNKEDKNKLVLIDKIFEKQTLKIKKQSKYFNKTITFHKPCHLEEKEFLEIESLLKNIKGINYKRLEKYDNCCGFGGSYFIFHPIVSAKIALKKAFNIKNTNPDLILTVCPSCTLGLRFSQLISFNFRKTLELRDFIEQEIEL